MWFALTLPFIFAVGAFAVDLPRMVTVTNELQNAADAAALAGAAKLASGTSTLNWSAATAAANAAVPLNASDGKQLVTGTATAGYWDVAAASPALVLPASEALPAPAGQLPLPAVKVTIARDGGANGIVSMLLSGLFGVPTASDSATAVAVVAPPSTIAAGGLYPVVMDQCVYNEYWDTKNNQPLIDPSTNAPYEVQIGNGATYGGSSCQAGQWTSFAISANDVPTVSGLMTNGNPTPLSIGENIYVQPGVKAALYKDVKVGVTVVMPVANEIDTKTYVPITAFAAFYIDGVCGAGTGSGCKGDKYIQGHFISGYKIPTQASGVSPFNYGAYTAPRIAY